MGDIARKLRVKIIREQIDCRRTPRSTTAHPFEHRRPQTPLGFENRPTTRQDVGQDVVLAANGDRLLYTLLSSEDPSCDIVTLSDNNFVLY